MPYRPSHAEHLARLMLHSIPEDIAKSIDSAELNDRVVETARLSAQAQDPALSTPLRQAARLRARAIAEAQPRAATLRQHADLIAKAAATRSAVQADAIRRQAERLIEEAHPIAPRRAVAKGMGRLADEAAARAIASTKARTVAKAGRSSGDKQMQAVFDQSGNLIGVVDPAKIQPVAGHGSPKEPAAAPPAQTAPAPAAGDAQVAKGTARRTAGAGDADLVQQVIKALGPKWIPVYQLGGPPVGVVKRKHVTALPAGRVAKGAAANVANIYDARRRRIGTAPVSAITSVAELRALRARGRARG